MRKTLVVLVALGVLAPVATAVEAKGNNFTQARTTYGLTSGGSLVRFDATNTSRSSRVGTVTGLAAGERLIGIDFRPATGELIGLGSKANLYRISQGSATASLKSTLTTAAGEPVTLKGTQFGIDFNPTSDRLRVTSDAEENLRINVKSGVTVVDQPIAYASGGGSPDAVGVAYTNNDNDSFVTPALIPFNRPAATGTRLYALDSARRVLALQDPPNDGRLRTVGSLRQSTTGDAGFDIYSQPNGVGDTASNTAYASLRRAGRTRLYRVSLRTGKAKLVRGNGRLLRNVTDIAIRP